MSVAILVGGLATRLYPITKTIPKSLVEIAGEPFLAHQLRLLRRNEIGRAVICAGYLGDMIQGAIGEGKCCGVEVSYSFDGSRLLGTGGAIKKALPQLSDPFFVLYGDSYLDCDYQAIGSSFVKSRKWGMMTVLRNQDRWDTSNVEFSNGRILAYNKLNRTSAMSYIDYGLGVFQKIAFRFIPEDTTLELVQVYNDLLQKDQLAGLEMFERFYEIGSPEGLEETRTYLTLKKESGSGR